MGDSILQYIIDWVERMKERDRKIEAKIAIGSSSGSIYLFFVSQYFIWLVIALRKQNIMVYISKVQWLNNIHIENMIDGAALNIIICLSLKKTNATQSKIFFSVPHTSHWHCDSSHYTLSLSQSLFRLRFDMFISD